ncbi:hypothetical protein ACVWZA_004265 [Sphingomonas sp. UYAg733]
MRALMLATLLFGCGTAAVGQIQSQKPIRPAQKPATQPTPNVFVPNTVQDAGALPPKPRDAVPGGAIGASWDRKAWITTIDGKRNNFVFSLGSEHVVRGSGLKGVVGAWITSMRLPPGKGKYESVGSVLAVVRESDTELVLRVTPIAGGKLPWSRLNDHQAPPRLKLRVDGGAREINIVFFKAEYHCAAGEPNCA